MTKEAITAKVNAKGDAIRQAKAAKADKQVIMPLVEELKALKSEYEAMVGEPWPTLAATAKKKKA
eukprot:COSAG05_NODE_15503_length_368_cov_0.546468_1_plen_64_part_10